jgi:hypothetical protein
LCIWWGVVSKYKKVLGVNWKTSIKFGHFYSHNENHLQDK